MVVLECEEYTRTVASSEGVFSVGLGRLRTVSADAGISFLASRPLAKALRTRERFRYQRNMAIDIARKSTAPTIPPASAPLLTPPLEEMDEPCLGTHFVCAQVLQSLLILTQSSLGPHEQGRGSGQTFMQLSDWRGKRASATIYENEGV